MRETRRPTALWVFTACYRDSFFLPHSVQTTIGPHSASFEMDADGSFPGNKKSIDLILDPEDGDYIFPYSSETSTDFQRTARRYIPEGRTLY
jgi:hypothetical protein